MCLFYLNCSTIQLIFSSKDILPHGNSDIPNEHFGLANSSKSIYDFHDESDRDEDCFKFTIDENPLPKNKKQGTGTLKVRFPGNY